MELQKPTENHNTGFISLYRSIKKHWIWADPVKFKWWIDILLTVNHEYKKVNIGNILVDCDRGQSVQSLETWAKQFNTNKSKIRRFLNLLDNDNMIRIESVHKSTRLTVLNYDSYQLYRHDNETIMKRKRNGSETQTTPNNNDNNDNNIIKDTSGQNFANFSGSYKKELLVNIVSEKYPELDFNHIEIAKSFQLLFKNNLIEAGVSTSNIDKAKGTWIDDIRLILRADGYPIEDLRDIYTFLQKNAFWKKNILSTAKLRAQMTKLKMEIHHGINKTSNTKTGATDRELATVISKHFAAS